MGEQPPVVPYARKPKAQPPFFTKLTLAAIFLAFASSIFPCMCGYLSPEALFVTVPAIVLAWADFLRPIVRPLRTRLFVMIVVVATSLLFLKNMADVLWLGHEPLLHWRPW